METTHSPVQSPPAPTRGLALWGALVALAWLVGGALYLTLPPSPDQFNLAYMGWRWLAGDVPYVDLIDVNWPGVIGLHALATWVFGIHLWTWRAFDFLMFGVTAVFLVDLVRRAAGPPAARICAVIGPLLYAGAGYWVAGQHDMSAAQFLVVALWCHVRGYGTRRWQWQVGTGLLLGAAMLCKPTVGAMLPLLALQAALLGEAWRRVAAHTAVASLALVGAIGMAVLAVLLRGTTLTDLFEVTVVFIGASQYMEDTMIAERSVWGYLLHTLVQRWGDLVVAAAPAACWMFRRGRASIATTALPVLWATGVISYFVQARGLPYHLAPSFLALVGMAAISIGVFSTGPRAPAKAGLYRAVLVGVVLVLFAGEAYKLARLYRNLPGAWASGDFSRHLAGFSAADGISVGDAVAFARLAATDEHATCLLAVGDGSAINYLAQLRQPTRFYYFPVIARTLPPLPMAERWLALWAADLKAADCPFALLSRKARGEWLRASGPAGEALQRFLADYDEFGRLGGPDGLLVYRRR